MRDKLRSRCILVVVVLCASFAPASAAMAEFGVASVENVVRNQDGSLALQAGEHPYELSTTIALDTRIDPRTGVLAPDENAKDIVVDMPAGFVGDPSATPTCPVERVKNQTVPGDNCPSDAQVGVVRLKLARETQPTVTYYPLFNVQPPAGVVARFGFSVGNQAVILLDSHVRTGGDYGVTTTSENLSELNDLIETTVTLWGVPADPSHDRQRCSFISESGECNGNTHDDLSQPHSSAAPAIPLLTNPGTCSEPLTIAAHVDSWGRPGAFSSMTGAYVRGLEGEPLAMESCGPVPFEPSIEVSPQSRVTDSPTGLDVDVHLPQVETSGSIATSTLKKAIVTLPPGLAVSPSAADGLSACSPQQIGLNDASVPSCPDASKLGSVEIDTPLLANPLQGSVYLAQQANNPFGSLLAIYLVAEGSGVLIKQAGQVTADPVTGQVTVTVANAPQLPFEDVKLHLFGGPRAALVNPATCGTYTTSASFDPWSGTGTVSSSSGFAVDSGCQGSIPFAPSFQAGTVSSQAGSFSAFTLTLARQDREQRLSGLTVKAPPGLLGVLKSVTQCPEPQAAQGTCGDGSLIGHVTSGVGAGSNPFYVQGGKAFLTGPYKGAPFGLSVSVPAVAGPFDLGTVVVRSRIDVDPKTSQITITSDPFPTILQGIPLDVRTVNVTVDRAGFMFNPTNCSPLSVDGTIASTQGASAQVSSHFQAANCATLGFNPVFKASTSGKTSRANGASLKVKLTYPNATFGTQANIKSVHVELPKALPSRLSTLKHACLDSVFNQDPANCPAQSRVGYAQAVTPVLPAPMEGPAYFVSHGGAKFPELIVVLQGDGVTIDLAGETFISKAGITSSTFKQVPDVPVASFELTLPESANSALAANANLCSVGLTMPTRFDAQNGAVLQQNTPIEVKGCPNALSIVSRKVHSRTLTVKVTVPQGGKLTASGKGVAKASKTAKNRQTLTLKLKEAKAGHLRTKVQLTFTPSSAKQRKILRKSITVTFK